MLNCLILSIKNIIEQNNVNTYNIIKPSEKSDTYIINNIKKLPNELINKVLSHYLNRKDIGIMSLRLNNCINKLYFSRWMISSNYLKYDDTLFHRTKQIVDIFTKCKKNIIHNKKHLSDCVVKINNSFFIVRKGVRGKKLIIYEVEIDITEYKVLELFEEIQDIDFSYYKIVKKDKELIEYSFFTFKKIISYSITFNRGNVSNVYIIYSYFNIDKNMLKTIKKRKFKIMYDELSKFRGSFDLLEIYDYHRNVIKKDTPKKLYNVKLFFYYNNNKKKTIINTIQGINNLFSKVTIKGGYKINDVKDELIMFKLKSDMETLHIIKHMENFCKWVICDS